MRRRTGLGALGVAITLGFGSVASADVRTIATACPQAEVTPAGFPDVSSTNPHLRAIDCVVWWDLLTGTTDGTFRPTQILTRGQAASFIERLVAQTPTPLPDVPSDHFLDDDGDVHELAINRLVDIGVITGLTPSEFGSSRPLTRGQLATIFVAALERARGPLPPGPDAFRDDDSSVHESAINKLAAAGVVSGGTATDEFVPGAGTSRAQAASFLARALDILAAEGRVSSQVPVDDTDAPPGGAAAWPGEIRFTFAGDTADLANERAVIRAAMATWQEVASVRFREVPASEPFDLEIGFATGCHGHDRCFDGRGGILAHATVGVATSGYLHFDDAEDWVDELRPSSAAPLDLFSVALHELGHVIGLGHSDDPSSVVHVGYSGSRRELSETDIRSARELYPA